MVSSICKAKDKSACPYHGAVMRMIAAQNSVPPDLDAYFRERTAVEEYEKRGWAEDDEVRQFATGLGGAIPEPLTKRPVAPQPLSKKDNPKTGDEWEQSSFNWKASSLPTPSYEKYDFKGALTYYRELHKAKGSSISDAEYTQLHNKALLTWSPYREIQENNLGEMATNTDPEILNGQVVDDINVIDEQGYSAVYHRRRDGVFPGTPYSMRFQANRPISDEEMNHLSQLIGYQYRATVRGESMGTPERDTPYSFTVYADTTKSSSDDLGHAMEKFETGLNDIIQNGSPVRTTDRSGPAGTRLVDGFNDSNLGLETYYDDVHVFDKTK